MTSIRPCRQVLTFGAIVACLMYSPLAAAAGERQEYSSQNLVKLESGVTHVDLNGDGVMDMVTKSRTAYGTAHDRSVYRFLLRLEAPYFPEVTWVIVPIKYPGDDKAWPEIGASEGADCILRDIRLLVDEEGKDLRTTLLIGDRSFGESWGDKEKITFEFYRFEQDPEAVPGSPIFYFRRMSTLEGELKYCDINKAFKDELGLD